MGALALADGHHQSDAAGAAGYGIFVTFMTIGRLSVAGFNSDGMGMKMRFHGGSLPWWGRMPLRNQ